jgi:hypothetical protein
MPGGHRPGDPLISKAPVARSKRRCPQHTAGLDHHFPATSLAFTLRQKRQESVVEHGRA